MEEHIHGYNREAYDGIEVFYRTVAGNRSIERLDIDVALFQVVGLVQANRKMPTSLPPSNPPHAVDARPGNDSITAYTSKFQNCPHP